eukprot:Gb_08081 [translate_table: standard]
MEETLVVEVSLRQGPPSTYADWVFVNEMNIGIKLTEHNYNIMMFREALKIGFYDLPAARNEYRLRYGLDSKDQIMASLVDRTHDLSERAQGDALYLLAYLDCSKEKESKEDSDRSRRNLRLVDDKPLKNEEKNHHKVGLDAIRKASLAKFGLRLTLDKVAGRKELKEHLKEGTSHCNVQWNMKHAKKVYDSKLEKTFNAIFAPTRKFDDIGKWGSHNENTWEEVLYKKG